MPGSTYIYIFIDAEGPHSEKPHYQAVSHCLPTHSLEVQPIRLVYLFKWPVPPTHGVYVRGKAVLSQKVYYTMRHLSLH